MLIEKLKELGYSDLKKLFEDYNNYIKETSPNIWKNIKFREEPNTLNIFTFRMNDVGVANDTLRDNDFLLMVENKDEDDVSISYLNCTVDPKTKRAGMAFLLPQQYVGNIGYHHGDPSRICIREDNDKVWVRRFNSSSKDAKYKDEYGNFTIHIHDTHNFGNTSLGCTVIANQKSYEDIFKPALTRVAKFHKSVPVSLINDNVALSLLQQ